LVASLTNFVLRQFLQRIVTADEICVHHYKPENKAQSMTWKRQISPVAKKFKSQLSAGKIMLTLFWDVEGAIFIYFTPKDETVNIQNYCYVERTKLKPRSKNWRGAKLVTDATNFFLTELKKF
jgi:hypothetical protein